MKDFLPDLGRITRETKFLKQGKVGSHEKEDPRVYIIPREELTMPAPTFSGVPKKSLFQNERERNKKNDSPGDYS
jgi:hypothetical protein